MRCHTLVSDRHHSSFTSVKYSTCCRRHRNLALICTPPACFYSNYSYPEIFYYKFCRICFGANRTSFSCIRPMAFYCFPIRRPSAILDFQWTDILLFRHFPRLNFLSTKWSTLIGILQLPLKCYVTPFVLALVIALSLFSNMAVVRHTGFTFWNFSQPRSLLGGPKLLLILLFDWRFHSINIAIVC